MLFDLVVDPLDQYVFTTGQDGLLRQWDVATGSLQRTLAPEAGAGEVFAGRWRCVDVLPVKCLAVGCTGWQSALPQKQEQSSCSLLVCPTT